MIVHVHTFGWNEAKILPFFFRHYDWADAVYYHDNHSTDRSLEIAKAAQICGPRRADSFDTGGVFSEKLLTAFRETCWQQKSGDANWVMIVDCDEFLYHREGMREFLNRLSDTDINVVKPFGWDMISDEFPRFSVPLTSQVMNGRAACQYSKPILFRPSSVSFMNLYPGSHEARPIDYQSQPVRIYASGQCWLLHYKRLGWDYYWARTQALRERSLPVEHQVGLNQHYWEPEEKHRKDWEICREEAVDLSL